MRKTLPLPLPVGRGVVTLLLCFSMGVTISSTPYREGQGEGLAPQHFPKQIPPGNYSGICPIGDNLFAVVDDKNAEDGFYVFRLAIDTLNSRITVAENLGYRSSGMPNRDMEGICYRPSSRTLFISGEADNEVYEYTLDGRRTGRRLAMPAEFKKARRNLGLEALAYDTFSHRFFTTTERPLPGDTLLRIQTFGDDLQPAQQYLYRPDPPISRKYYHGVSALCALGDGRLLVLERQLRAPRLKLNAHTVIRIYEVQPPTSTFNVQRSTSTVHQELPKRLVTEFRTRLTLTSRKFANYEGLCFLPSSEATDECGGYLLLIADSQHHYKGILHDWFLLISRKGNS